VPVDERHPLRPESSYALSKVLGEEMARQFSRWSGIPFVGLRFSNVMERADYDEFPSWWDDPQLRKWNLWSYVDESHAGQSVRLALEADTQGAQAFIIAAADTVMRRPSRELMAEVYPGVPGRGQGRRARRAARHRRRPRRARLRPGSSAGASFSRGLRLPASPGADFTR
jgi:nucleoside-diphosphate-sugar epimerase